MKRCTVCGISKRPLAFGLQQKRAGRKARLRSECKECRCKSEKAKYKAKTPEQKVQANSRRLKRLYGLSIEDYNTMFTSQEGKCRGCKKHQSEFPIALSVDHDHLTNEVRGLLCSGCNLAIGNVGENTETLVHLSNYLRSFK